VASVALDVADPGPNLQFTSLLATSMPMVVRTSLAIWLLVASVVTAQEPAGPRNISVVGSVYDSVANRPLIGALVQIVRTDELRSARSSTTDSRGRYRIDSLIPGEYYMSFFHAAVDSLAVVAPVRRVALGARDPERVELALPGAERIIAALCPGFSPGDSSAVILGDVRDADTGAPVASANVVAAWVDVVIEKKRFLVEPQAVGTTSGVSGSFALCGMPSGQVAVQAMSASRATGRLEVTVEPRSIVRRDFTLAEGTTFVTMAGEPAQGDTRVDTLLRGPARLSGTVLNETGRPVSDAIVEVWRTGISTRTDESGHFQLASLPVGTHALEVRRIGFAPQQLPVQLASRSPTSVNVVLEKPVRLLDAVRVSARTLYSRRGREIEERRRRGFGHFIMREELERHPSARVTDVLRRVPGVRVYPGPTGDLVTFASAQRISGPCRPTVFLDGHKLGSGQDLDALTTVSSLEAIEVYPRATQVPVEYWGDGCGVIVLWTRVDPMYPKPPKPKKDKKEKPKTDAPPGDL
jgi:protocatechuate 3,4-dioxygenase beta subunit